MVKTIAEGLLTMACKLAFIKARIARRLLYFSMISYDCRKGNKLMGASDRLIRDKLIGSAQITRSKCRANGPSLDPLASKKG